MVTTTGARAAALLAALLIVTGIAYSSSLDGGLLFDDVAQISQNRAVKDLAGFAGKELGERLGTGTRVLPDLTFAANYAWSGLDPRAFHLTSLAFHLLAVLGTYFLGRRLLAGVGWPEPRGPALAAAAIWALHPLNSQAVNYVVQRSEVMASLFYLLALLLVLVAAERGRTGAGVAAYLGALGAALAGFDSKPIVVTLPATIVAALVLVHLPGGPRGRAWVVRLGMAAPFALLAARIGLRTVRSVEGSGDAGFDIPGLTPWDYALSQPGVLVRYLRLLAWPAGLNLDHDVAPSHSLLEPGVLASGALLLGLCAGVGALAWWASRPGRNPGLARASRLAAFGVAWFFIVVSPTSSIVPLVDLMFEHRVYLASWGLVLAAVALASVALERRVHPPARAAMAGLLLTLLVCAVLGVALHRRNAVWADPGTVWADAAAKAPGNWRAYQNQAQVVASRGDFQRALQLRERALALASRPEDRAEVLRNMGANLIDLGQLGRATAVLVEAEKLLPRDAGVQNNLAICFEAQGLLDEAERRARRSIQLDADQPNGYTTLGQILARRGDLPGALSAFRQASVASPDDPTPLYNVAQAQELLGMQREACATWRRYGQLPGGGGRQESDVRRGRLRCGVIGE